MVSSTNLHYWKAKCKYKYLVFLKFVASVSIRVRINIRIQSLVIQTCIEKSSYDIKYYTIHICYVKKNINIAIANIIRRPSNWYSFGIGIASDVVPSHGIFCNRMFHTHFLQTVFDDPTNYRPQYGSSLKLWTQTTSIDIVTKRQTSIIYVKIMDLD